ncbi:ExbD/TolR family protein [Pedobacter boryungensis]|uniref:Biopolymer transporter ExbD n=1 Tax=Pedobacter boryungensis TaxID=869962 RepID=A0ABX2DFZ3_9SPHI|nr:biopolymer transporter ExbD [Pedobacter boryungensis]NQX32850.1 biopolymer transporter ExbD [Pedobacter boryungensis]
MASLNIPQNGKAVNGRTKKPLPSVDLTAMVDLAFLLITFFMLTTSLAKMKALEIAKPVPSKPIDYADYPASRTMTILLGKNNQAVYYTGEAKNAAMQMINLTSIKKVILLNKLRVAKNHTTDREKEMLVIIKPTNTSTYKNFVDIIDEMNISNIKSYAIDDKYIADQEKVFLKEKGI